MVDGLLREQVYSHQGDHYTVDDARMIPGCIQRPRLPLVIAAEGTKSFALAARYGDAWVTHAEDVADRVGRLERACETIGRDPATIDRIYMVDNSHARPLASIDTFRDFAGRMAELGFTDIVFHHPRADDPVWDDDEAIVEAIAAEMLRPR